MIKAIVAVALMVGVVFLGFGGAVHLLVAIGSGAAAIWMLFYLIVMIAVMIALSQENTFKEKVEKVSKAFWNW